jgi:two-component system cell cycle response regulator CpdR
MRRLTAMHKILLAEDDNDMRRDIVMPEMDGIELARRASELDPDIKIMFITGFAAVALNSDSEAPKNAKVLAKPVHLRELVSEVNKMLAA